MKLYRLTTTLELPLTLEEAWNFFSDPRNLATITPPELQLIPDSPLPERMYPGMIVTYNVQPVPLLRSRWVTEITHVEPLRYFVDEQRFGPYRFWHHQHHFTSIPSGVLMEDAVHYMLPFDPFSRPLHALFVRRQLQRIFAYRTDALRRMFPSHPLAAR